MISFELSRSAEFYEPTFSKWTMNDITKSQCEVDPKSLIVTEYMMFINMVSDSILQLSFKKLPSVKFCCSYQRRLFSYKKKLLKYSSPFKLHICVKSDQNIHQKNSHCKRLNAEAHNSIQLSSIKWDIKEIFKNVKQCHHASFYFHSWKIFLIKIYYLY